MQSHPKILRYWIAGLLLIISLPSQARLQYVTLDSEGSGITSQAAINDALVNAISQVNGTVIAAKTELHSSEYSDGKKVESIEDFQQTINKVTNGLIKEYEVLNKLHATLGDKLWTATVRVTVAKYSVSKQASRLRMAVIPFTINGKIPDWKKPDDFQKSMTQNLVSHLTQTRKFAMLDRENMDAQEKELAMLSAGSTPIEELAKLGQKLSTDYIIIGNIDNIHYRKSSKTLKVSGKTITTIKQGARISYRIIDVATGQIKHSDYFDKILYSSGTNVSSSTVAKKAAFSIGDIILNAIFPIRVEAVRDKDLFLGQGGKTLRKGDNYTLVMLGNALKDSYTGESLGREETEVGTVRITSVQAKTSKAKIVSAKVNVAELFKPGLFILRPKDEVRSEKVDFKKKEKAARKSVESFEKSISNDW